MAEEKKIKVEAGDNTVSFEGGRDGYMPWRQWMYVAEAVELRAALDKAICEATRKGRERAQESSRAADGCGCRCFGCYPAKR